MLVIKLNFTSKLHIYQCIFYSYLLCLCFAVKLRVTAVYSARSPLNELSSQA